MTDKWLAILNDGNNRLICQGPGRCFSMVQLRHQINRLQAAIIKKGYQEWVLYDDNGFRFICAMFALLMSGRKILIPSSRNMAAIECLLEPGVGFIGSHSDFQKRIDIATSLDEKIEHPGTTVDVACSRGWGRVAFCTSGSSGKPKLITKSAEQLYLEAENFNLKWQPSPTTLFIPLVTHLHIYGLAFAFLLPLVSGASFYLLRNRGLLGAVEPLTLDSECRIDELAVISSPTIGRQTKQIRTLVEPGSVSMHDRPAPVAKVFVAGGKLTAANATKIIDLFNCPVTEVFGSTETGAVATREHNKQHQSTHDDSFQLLPGLNAMALKDSAETEAESNGEFAAWGGHVGGSKDAPVRSGDVVNFVDRRRFELLGRSNRVYKIEGKRVTLDHVIELLEGCELVLEAAVLPVETIGKEVLLCAVVLSPVGESSYRSSGKFATDLLIRRHLLRFLDPVLTPRNIRYLDQMPHNETGKIPRHALVELLVNPVFAELPLIENVKSNRKELMISMRIPMELRFLRGHFESKPIVPGVVLLHWVYHFISEYWKLPMNPGLVNRLKFSKPLTPGDKLTLTIKQFGNEVEFLYQNEQKTKFLSGKIPLLSKTRDV